jgi:SAM-dependent methyltransferase
MTSAPIDTDSTRKIYWYGNVAKMQTVDTILQDDRALTIFDYGCGDAGDWPTILAEHPQLKLIGYEPFAPSYQKAVRRLAGMNADLLTGSELKDRNFKADVIVSFSVFEHVFARKEYLRQAKEHLAADGVFYLNYDDGHFRNLLDLNSAATWPGNVRTWLHNLFAPTLAKVGHIATYQRRVAAREAEDLVIESGFRILHSEYNNLVSLKVLSKTIRPEKQQEFSRFWIRVEEELNNRFLSRERPYLGDDANLWREMPSRTFTLRHA